MLRPGTRRCVSAGVPSTTAGAGLGLTIAYEIAQLLGGGHQLCALRDQHAPQLFQRPGHRVGVLFLTTILIVVIYLSKTKRDRTELVHHEER